jgi:signal transduction histidine kinase
LSPVPVSRSLYWRIGLGFIVFLAIMLVAQVGVFVWLAVETEGGLPERMGRDFAELVATEFEGALAKDPSLDLEQYARTRIDQFHRPVIVVIARGPVVAPADTVVPPGLERLARRGFERPPMPGGEPRPRRGDRAPAGRPSADALRPPPGAGSGGFFVTRRPPAAATVRNPQGEVVAMVFVSPLGARRIVEQFGPYLAVGALLLLVGGTALAALLIFRPAHTQLRALEDAARRFGEGDLAARAPATGGDEVAAVAQAFNRMADDLSARQRQLEDADRARRQLLADVSHELMTPLTAIRGYAETLSLPQFGPASADGQRYVHIIQEEGERIERLVGDLLDLARYEASGVTFVREPVSIAELFDRVVERHEQAARGNQVTIDVRLPDEEMTVMGDPRRLEQALQNLASNALRHAPAGGRVTVSAEQKDGVTWLRVADSGMGIPAEHLPHVFDRFYKADASRTESGSGLGLSIVKAIVERHGGQVSVESTPGVQTVFTIRLATA